MVLSATTILMPAHARLTESSNESVLGSLSQRRAASVWPQCTMNRPSSVWGKSNSCLPSVVFATPSRVQCLDLEMCFAPQQRVLFDIWTSKSDPNLMWFDLQMCFAPQRHALFRSLNFKKCPNLVCFVYFDLQMCSHHNGVHFFDIWTSKVVRFGGLSKFWLGNVLRVTIACFFSTARNFLKWFEYEVFIFFF